MGRKTTYHGPDPFKVFPEFNEFLEYFSEYRTNSRDSVKVYYMALLYFGRYLLADTEIRDVRSVKREDLNRLKDLMEERKHSMSDMAFKFTAIRGMYSWMIEEGRIIDNPCMMLRRMKGVLRSTPVVITPAQIFQIREIRCARLERATAFEALVSSGMRVSELVQLRAYQVEFGVAPHDVELQIPSPYVGARIRLTKETGVLKREKSRIVFLGKLATKLMLAHMKSKGIPQASNLPLFPLTRFNLNIWLNDFLKEIGYTAAEIYQPKTNSIDIDTEEIDLTPEMKVRIERQRKKEENYLRNMPDPTKKIAAQRRVRGVTVHSLRHAYTSFQYYRNYWGERQAVDRLRINLGHDKADVTMEYLTQMDLVTNDDTWKRLWVGRPTDWFAAE